jgi:hypothetical protein
MIIQRSAPNWSASRHQTDIRRYFRQFRIYFASFVEKAEASAKAGVSKTSPLSQIWAA